MSAPKPSVALWMPVFIKDARARAGTLSHVEHSALNYLLMLLWEHDGSIADDDKAIAKELKLTVRQWQAMRPTLLADCTIAQGRITRPETASELTKARRNIAQKSAAGRASAEARKSNGRSTDDATAVQPHAGGGEGVGNNLLYQEKGKRGSEPHAHTHTRDGLTIIAGGAR
ncbi:DUF1376 domain-containing protein [Sphingomonas crocodyli]|uniref:DUF1376 domain-containing protein n=1 Tax=Sphingomonas crocodyli TaxID=1979270 RepID=A0A437M853_9SPHN|nr:DUF1376 domain-containing protein [Sphingomonas crocodyli]RVT93715.1 DUF1376 domain-containing protein [Sphingomonas crocodyli]